MNGRLILPITLLVAVVVGPGCCSSGRKAPVVEARAVVPVGDPYGAPGMMPPRYAPPSAEGRPTTLPPAEPLPPAPPGGLPSAPQPVIQGNFTPSQPEPSRPSAEPNVRLAPPEPMPTEVTRAESPEPPRAADAPKPPDTPRPIESPKAAVEGPKPSPPAALPVDIPQFARARDRVYGGERPGPDGVAWLREHGYRAVIHVRPPNSDDAAARRLFEANNLQYYSIEADARTLSRETVDRFNKLVGDTNNLPLFVYDKDAAVAGGLWYLHFRLVEGSSDEDARAEAARLGFHPDQDDTHRTMMVAVQKLLEANGR